MIWQHFQKNYPKNNQDLQSFLGHKTVWKRKNGPYEIYCQFTKTGLKQVYFSFPEEEKFWTPIASLISNRLKNVPLNSIWDLSWYDLYQWLNPEDEGDCEFIDWFDDGLNPLSCLPISLLKIALLEHLGMEKSHCELTNQDKDDLLCPCFAVYKKDILSELEKNPLIEMKDLNSKFKVGVGCGNCSEELLSLLSNQNMDSLFRQDWISDVQSYSGLCQVELLQELEHFFTQQKLAIEILSLRGLILSLKLKSQGECELKELSELIFQKFGVRLFVRFDS